MPTIRINAGAAPKYGRITMPRGTFLSNQPAFSNPSTAPSGALGGGGGSNPPPFVNTQVQLTGGGVSGGSLAGMGGLVAPYSNQGIGNVTGIGPAPTGTATSIGASPDKIQYYSPAGVPISGYKQTDIWNGKEETYYNPVAFDRQGNRYTWDAAQQRYVRDESGLLTSSSSSFSNKNTNANPLVGGLTTDPNQVTTSQIQSMIPGMSPDEINTYMTSRGYTRGYVEGVGEVWNKASESAPADQLASTAPKTAISAETDARGRPTFVDPTLLTPGQRVTASSGITFYGGTPTKEGKSQYAVVMPGRNDPHGRYKTVSYTKQDAEGNWVRVTYQQLKGAYTRHGRQKIAARRAARRRPGQQQENASALVTLRANYG